MDDIDWNERLPPPPGCELDTPEPEETSSQFPGKLQEKVPVGLEMVSTDFDLCNKVLGLNGVNLEFIRSETGAEVTLRGRGSGTIEQESGLESSEPLYVEIKHIDSTKLKEARKLTLYLIKTIYEEFYQFYSEMEQSLLEPPPQPVEVPLNLIPSSLIVSPPTFEAPHQLISTSSYLQIVNIPSNPIFTVPPPQSTTMASPQPVLSPLKSASSIQSMAGPPPLIQSVAMPLLLPHSMTVPSVLSQSVAVPLPLPQSKAVLPPLLQSKAVPPPLPQSMAVAPPLPVLLSFKSKPPILKKEPLQPPKLSLKKGLIKPEKEKTLNKVASNQGNKGKQGRRKFTTFPDGDEEGKSLQSAISKTSNNLASNLRKNGKQGRRKFTTFPDGDEEGNESLQSAISEFSNKLIDEPTGNKAQEGKKTPDSLQYQDAKKKEQKASLAQKVEKVQFKFSSIFKPKKLMEQSDSIFTRFQDLKNVEEGSVDKEKVGQELCNKELEELQVKSRRRLTRFEDVEKKEAVGLEPNLDKIQKTQNISEVKSTYQPQNQLIQPQPSQVTYAIHLFKKTLHHQINTIPDGQQKTQLVRIMQLLRKVLTIQNRTTTNQYHSKLLLIIQLLEDTLHIETVNEHLHLLKSTNMLKNVLQTTSSTVTSHQQPGIAQNSAQQLSSSIQQPGIPQNNTQHLLPSIQPPGITQNSAQQLLPLIQQPPQLLQITNLIQQTVKNQSYTSFTSNYNPAETITTVVSNYTALQLQVEQIIQQLQKRLRSQFGTNFPDPAETVLPYHIMPLQLQLVQIKHQLEKRLQTDLEINTRVQQSKISQLVQQLQQCMKPLQPFEENFTTQEGNGGVNDSDTFTQSLVVVQDKKLSITLIPSNVDSLYASLAYLLLSSGNNTVEELIKSVTNLMQQMIQFIRNNKEMFFTKLNTLYDKVFQTHSLDSDLVFEHCCLYLTHPGHLGINESVLAVATLFHTPIVILDEDGQQPIQINPLCSWSAAPIAILSCKSRAQFVPVNHYSISQCAHFDFLVATWHVQGKTKWTSVTEMYRKIDECLVKYKIDLACIQGTKFQNGQMFTQHYSWWSSSLSSTSQGVALLLRRQSDVKMISFLPASNSFLISALVSLHDINFQVIGCHFPVSSDRFHDQVAADLLYALNRVKTSSQILLLGDFNARIGRSDVFQDENSLIGNDLYHKISDDNGILLKEWAINHNLCIVTSFPSKQVRSPVTYKGESGSSQISHILLENKLSELALKSYRWWEFISDHAIVACNINRTPKDSVYTSSEIPIVEAQFIVATWHVEDCSTVEKQDAIDKILLNYNIDMACIQGRHFVRGQLSTAHYNWWCTGEPTSPFSTCLAFVLRKKCGLILSNFNCHTNSLASAVVSVQNSCFAVVGCHLPDSSDQYYQQIAADLMLVLNWAPSSAKLLLLGDFNAHIGSTDLTWFEKSLLVESSLSCLKSNVNGILLKRLALLHNFFLCSTLFQPAENYVNLQPQVSHILLQQSLKKSVANIWNVPLMDHAIVAYNIHVGPLYTE